MRFARAGKIIELLRSPDRVRLIGQAAAARTRHPAAFAHRDAGLSSSAGDACARAGRES